MGKLKENNQDYWEVNNAQRNLDIAQNDATLAERDLCQHPCAETALNSVLASMTVSAAKHNLMMLKSKG